MKYKFIFAALSCLMISSCSAGVENGLVYPHTNSPYLFAKKPQKSDAEIKKEYQSSSVVVNLENNKNKNLETHKNFMQTHLIRERVFIDASYDKVWQALLKFAELNNYHIRKSNMKEGFLEVDISSNVAQYYSTSMPKEVALYTQDKSSLNGIVAWNFYVVIFASNAGNKTLLEFIPKYYIITSKTHNAEYMVKSNGYFENKCLSFVKQEVNSY